MGFDRAYSKRLRLEKNLANEFSSCRQYLPEISTTPKDNDALRALVVNKAIARSFDNGFLRTLADLCDHSRLNGTTIEVNVSVDNWFMLVDLLNRKLNKLDEWDLMGCSLKEYIDEMKLKRCLP